MRLYYFTMIWYTLGLMVAACMAEYRLEGWREAFWVWDKGKDLLLFVLLIHRPQSLPGIGILISFAVARLLLELFIIFTGWNVNNILLIRVLFLLYLLICLIWLFKELRKWQRSKSG